MENFTYRELDAIQSSIVYKVCWDERITEEEKIALISLSSKMASAMAFAKLEEEKQMQIC